MVSDSHFLDEDSLDDEKACAPTPDSRRRWAIVLIAVVALIVSALLVGGLVNSSGLGADSPETSAEPVPSEETKTPRPEFPTLPKGAEPVNDAARNGKPSGNFNNVWRGTANTSADFALAVRETYVRHYLRTGEFNAKITVFSEVVQRNFPLTCTDNDSFVTCTLGRDVVVYIA